MSGIKKVLQNKAYWALPLLAAGLLLYPVHAIFSYLFAIGLLLCCAFLPVVPLCCLYIVLFCFDPVLPFPLLGGSVVRVMQGGLFIRLTVAWIRLRIRPRIEECIAGALVILSCGIGLIRGIQSDALSFLVNMGLFLLLRPVLRRQEDPMQDIAEKCIRAMAWSVLLALLWGLCYQRFLVVPVGGMQLLRFMGTYEPNFMATFANVAWVGLLCLPPRRTWQDTIMLGLLLLCLLLTYSVTGYLVVALMCCLLILPKAHRKERFIRFARCLLVAIPLFACITFLLPTLWAQESENSTETLPSIASEPLRNEQGEELSSDPADLALLPEEYEAARAAGETPVAYRRPLNLVTPVARLRIEQAEALAGQSNPLTARIQDFLWCASTGNWDLLSSGRLGLWTEKLKDFAALPLWQKLIGTGPAPALTYMPLAYTLSYTHNSYLDMLYSFGILGFLLICWYLVQTTRKRRFMGVSLAGSDAGQALFYLRITLLLEMCSLTIYLNRVVLFFFL